MPSPRSYVPMSPLLAASSFPAFSSPPLRSCGVSTSLPILAGVVSGPVARSDWFPRARSPSRLACTLARVGEGGDKPVGCPGDSCPGASGGGVSLEGGVDSGEELPEPRGSALSAALLGVTNP